MVQRRRKQSVLFPGVFTFWRLPAQEGCLGDRRKMSSRFFPSCVDTCNCGKCMKNCFLHCSHEWSTSLIKHICTLLSFIQRGCFLYHHILRKSFCNLIFLHCLYIYEFRLYFVSPVLCVIRTWLQITWPPQFIILIVFATHLHKIKGCSHYHGFAETKNGRPSF